MNRAGFSSILALAVGVAVPGLASGQAVADHAFTTDGEPSVAIEVEQPTTAAEQLRPAASTAALFSPIWAQSRLDDATEPYRQVEVDNRNDRGLPYMIAGGVLFVAGAIAGGDAGTILMLGGAGIGAYGTFVYFGGD